MSFVRRSPSSTPSQTTSPVVKTGPNATLLVSTGVAELDKLVGGGVGLGKVIVVMEDARAPHHLLLVRYFMAQAVSHGQPLLFGSALASPHNFLSTLPAPCAPIPVPGQQRHSSGPSDPGLRIAWQYHRYDKDDNQEKAEAVEYVSRFDMREWSAPVPARVQCHSFIGAKVGSFLKQCREFVTKLKSQEARGEVGRIAVHSMCAPQCMDLCSEWELLSSLLHLKALLHNTSAVAMITVPTSLLAASSTRWRHLADILLSIKALPEEEQAVLDRDTVGLLHVHKLCTYNTQVPAVPESAAYAVKVIKKRELVLEQIHLAPSPGAQGCHSST